MLGVSGSAPAVRYQTRRAAGIARGRNTFTGSTGRTRWDARRSPARAGALEFVDVLLGNLPLREQTVGPGCLGGLRLMVEAFFLALEGSRHREDGCAVLNGHDAPRGEALAVSNAIDVVHDGAMRVAGA